MFSITLKRSIATLGVVAGLLAAAVPASAAPTEELFGNYNFAVEAEGTQVGSEGVKAPTKAGPQPNVNPLETVSFAIKGAAFRGEVTGLEPY